MSEQSVTSARLGLPRKNVDKWFCDKDFTETIGKPKFNPKPLENLEIPLLKNYNKDPGKEFWTIFPFNPLPSDTDKNTPIDISALQRNYFKARDSMSNEEIEWMETTLDNLKYGASAHVDEAQLPAMEAPNSTSMLEPRVGQLYTDTLASMIKSGIVAGPFDAPPLDDFRANSLFVIEQHNKNRPILNLSYPPGASYNDAIDKSKLRKVKMCSVKEIASLIKSIGINLILLLLTGYPNTLKFSHPLYLIN